jgi:hypothetical protein
MFIVSNPTTASNPSNASRDIAKLARTITQL